MATSHTRKVVLTVALILLVQVVAGLVIFWRIESWELRGQFGDMFGVVNALFSGLAFGGVIYAILLQREDLALQREELTLTRAELRRSAEAQEKSERALSLQAEASTSSAKLATINALVAHYESQIEPLQLRNFMDADPSLLRLRELTEKKEFLLRLLDAEFEFVVRDEIQP